MTRDKKIKVAFRVDGGPEIGMGHIYECLALAKELASLIECDILFVAKKDYGVVDKLSGYQVDFLPSNISMREAIQSSSDIFSRFSTDIAILDITDPYPSIKQEPSFFEWITELREKGVFVIGIEGIATENYRPNIIINGTIVPEWHNYDKNLDTEYYIGSKYMILDKQFEDAHHVTRVIPERCSRLLVCMGGSDPQNSTIRVLNALRDIEDKVRITVVVGPAYRELPELEELSKNYPMEIELHHNVNNMARLMLSSDIAITSAGKILYELCAAGTPSIATPIVEHQVYTAAEMERRGVTVNLGLDASEERIRQSAADLASDTDMRKRMSLNGKKLVDGGGGKRVAGLVIKNWRKTQ